MAVTNVGNLPRIWSQAHRHGVIKLRRKILAEKPGDKYLRRRRSVSHHGVGLLDAGDGREINRRRVPAAKPILNAPMR